MLQHVVEKVVENGKVLQDVDYAIVRHSPNQFVVQGFNRNIPFIMTNMSPQALQKVYKKKKPTAKTKKGFKKSNTTQKKTKI